MICKVLTAFVESARAILERIQYGPREAGEMRRVEIDCPDHGRTFANSSRTACCNSRQWVPAGAATSRRDGRTLSGAVRSLARKYAGLA